MTPSEVITNPGFKKIVAHAVKKKGLPYLDDEYLDDVVQDTALRILRYGTGKATGLATIVINHTTWALADRLKSKKSHKYTPLIQDFEEESNFQSSIDHKDQCEEIYDMITPSQKQVVDLILSGLTPTEASKTLGCRKQNVFCLLNTIKKTAQRILGEVS